jgi:hypothetical protein
MATEDTELEWSYSPPDFFETPYRGQTDDYVLFADSGLVRVRLRTPSDTIDAELRNRITKEIQGLLRLRQLQVHRQFKLGVATIYQRQSDGKKSVSISVGGVFSLAKVGQVDIVLCDASGVVVHDSKAERIKEHTRFIDSIMPKLASSTTLNAVLESYNAAVSDPTNELVHLYEIRDALAKHYGGDAEPRRKLRIAEKDWKRLGALANTAPLKEGRHRGKHSKLRQATAAELDEARKIARCLIEAFANQL